MANMSRPFAYVAACLLFPAAVVAADISVMPVGLTLSAQQDRQAITVTNQGKERVTMQVDRVSWTQADGLDKYAPTQDLLVNPPLFSLLPGRSQILRVGLIRPPDGEKEAAYRIFLREVPRGFGEAASLKSADNGQVRMLLELRLPIYVTPTNVVRAQKWHAQRNVDGSIAVVVVNTGNVHLVVGELQLFLADVVASDPPFSITKTSVAVFPGQSRRWEIRLDQPLTSQRVVLEVSTDRGRQKVPLELAR